MRYWLIAVAVATWAVAVGAQGRSQEKPSDGITSDLLQLSEKLGRLDAGQANVRDTMESLRADVNNVRRDLSQLQAQVSSVDHKMVFVVAIGGAFLAWVAGAALKPIIANLVKNRTSSKTEPPHEDVE